MFRPVCSRGYALGTEGGPEGPNLYEAPSVPTA